PVENPEPLRPPNLAEPLARFELLLSAAVGFVWGPLLFHFVWQGLESAGLPSMLACGALTLALGWLGSRAPPQYFRVRSWERRNGGRLYERYFGIRAFKRWMSNGDWVNAWLRRRAPDYRVVRPTRADVAAYGKRTESIER